MKSQALFCSKDKSKKLKCRLLQYLFRALRVNTRLYLHENQNYPVCEEGYTTAKISSLIKSTLNISKLEFIPNC